MEECGFKVGDRVKAVKAVDRRRDLLGKEGKVIEIDYSKSAISVEFDEDIKGHNCSGKGKPEHCWCGFADDFEKK